jgi:hypothetical protein
MEIVSNNLNPIRRASAQVTPHIEHDPFSYEMKINNDRALRALERARSIAVRNEKMAQELKARSDFFFSNSEKFLLQ